MNRGRFFNRPRHAVVAQSVEHFIGNSNFTVLSKFIQVQGVIKAPIYKAF